LSKKIQDKYNKQFEKKKEKFHNFFKSYTKKISYHKSSATGFRTRIEFGVAKINNLLEFYMIENSLKVAIKQIEICNPKINSLMESLIEEIRSNEVLRNKLFQTEFMVSRNRDSVISLIYHKPLDSEWIKIASDLSVNLNSSIVGRSKKQKIILGKDHVLETYKYNTTEYSLNLFEQCFCQPNPYICESIIHWINQQASHEKDVLEFHCGIGTFTIFLSHIFDNVIATESSRPSIRGLIQNINLNECSNIYSARLADIETLEALNKKRTFKRLKKIDLCAFNLSTVFIDPPRSGLDTLILEGLNRFKQIIYVSCEFESLKKDVEYLSETHKIEAAGFFDQFPYTDHIESAVVLKNK